jgi:hypothetical protein
MTTDSQRNSRAPAPSCGCRSTGIGLTAQHGESEEKALDRGARDYLGRSAQTGPLKVRERAGRERSNI